MSAFNNGSGYFYIMRGLEREKHAKTDISFPVPVFCAVPALPLSKSCISMK